MNYFWPKVLFIPALIWIGLPNFLPELLYSIFKSLTSIPINYWFYLTIITSPILIFSSKPVTNSKYCYRRLILSIILTYGLINLSLQTGRNIKWKIYEMCQSQFPDGAVQYHESCPRIDIGDGASSIFYLYFGWIACIAYTGIWELIWRKYYSQEFQEINKSNKYIKVSNQLIKASVPVWIYFIIIILVSITASLLDNLIIPLVNTITSI